MNNKTTNELYADAINILNMVELMVESEKSYFYIRKMILDLANDIKRNGDANGE